ncbi:acetyl-CoA carboxylase biotin carboxylase subunit [Candidatus Leptofilum sp.]|uniref:acetyl-CoA carboxylase biotin carboxylase subunit n=1 Tax=Candidatus Leptofilum sp. TaxID=3241576 RepID=UPI003B5B206E
MIRSILIANRGEIAYRIVRSCQRLGIRTVAVYSAADVGAKHVKVADTAVSIGPPPATQSYLNQNAILDAARQTGVDAIHPGYGFLAENAAFARACSDAGFIFIGPNAEAIELMGNKRAAKKLMAQAGVPLLPGYAGEDQADGRFQTEAQKIGLPVMVKAAAGGGGKGMRFVFELDELPEALATCRREAKQAFGSDELLLEALVFQPRHVEIQVFGDQQGNIIHLGERDCSIQRRHQKVIEEAPSPALTPELRAQMGETAVAAARAVNYDNAGTVEFLLDHQGNYYFLEMNTRLQVEHPVTEMVTGQDLVAWQIAVAAGAPLPLAQDEISLNGHAIEARLYAENPANDFLPVTGPVLLWQSPAGEGVRVDDGIQTGDDISVHYDPMLAKIIVHGPDRETAVQRLDRALQTAVLLGFTHNLPYLQAIVQQPEFASGQYNTHFLADKLANWQPPASNLALGLIGAALAQFFGWPQHPQSSGYWRNNPNGPIRSQFLADDETITVLLEPLRFQTKQFDIIIQGEQFAVACAPQVGPDWTMVVNGRSHKLIIVQNEADFWVQTDAGAVCVTVLPRLSRKTAVSATAGSLRAPMPGSVLAVMVKPGQTVAEGDPLLKLEAMKMEHTIRAPAAGRVAEIFYAPGDTVPADAQLLRLEFAN